MAINLSAARHLTRLTLRGMKARGWGRIVTIGSAHVLLTSPYKSALVMVKHAVVGLTKTLALEAAEGAVIRKALLAAFLCSPAAAEITGTAIPVDGGWTPQ